MSGNEESLLSWGRTCPGRGRHGCRWGAAGNKEQGDGEAGGARYLEDCIESKEKPGERCQRGGWCRVAEA